MKIVIKIEEDPEWQENDHVWNETSTFGEISQVLEINQNRRRSNRTVHVEEKIIMVNITMWDQIIQDH